MSPGHLFGIEFFEWLQMSVRIAADAPQQISQLLADDLRADVLVRNPELVEVLVVEEVSERSVADVMEQPRHANEAFDVGPRRHVGTGIAEGIVPGIDHAGCQVHDTERMLKPHVLGRGEDPPGGLQLVDVPQPLHPRVVNHFLLGGLAGGEARF